MGSQLLLRISEKIRRAISEGNIVSVTNKNICKKYIYYFLTFCTLAADQHLKMCANRSEPRKKNLSLLDTVTISNFQTVIPAKQVKPGKSFKSSLSSTSFNFLALLPTYLHSIQSLLILPNLPKLWSMSIVSEVLLNQLCIFSLKVLEEKLVSGNHLPVDIICKSMGFFAE